MDGDSDHALPLFVTYFLFPRAVSLNRRPQMNPVWDPIRNDPGFQQNPYLEGARRPVNLEPSFFAELKRRNVYKLLLPMRL